MLNLFTLLVFLLVLVGFFAIRSVSKKQRNEEAVALRLQQLQTQLENEGIMSAQAIIESADSIVLPTQDDLFPAWPWLGRKLGDIRSGLQMLGWYKDLRTRVLISACAAVVGSLVLARMAGVPLWTFFLAAPILWLVVCAWIYQSALNKHLALLLRSLPEAIDAITRICRAGVPINGAFGIAAENLRGPIAAELREIEHWLKLGVPLKAVMQSSAQRVPLREYRFFAVILIISQESGGRLGDTLERLSATLRAREELGMKVQAKTSEARASAKIVALLVPGVLLYMYLNAPQDFRFMFNDSAGIKVMTYATCSVLLGLLITHLMVRRIR